MLASTDDKLLPSAEEGARLQRELPNAKLTLLQGSGHLPLLEAPVSLRNALRETGLLARAPKASPKPKDYVRDWRLPEPAQYKMAADSLRTIRRLTSPIFLSTDGAGRRVAGLGALPPLAAADGPPVLFVGNHQIFGLLDLPLVWEEVWRQTGTQVRALAHPSTFRGRTGAEGEVPPPSPPAGAFRGRSATGGVGVYGGAAPRRRAARRGTMGGSFDFERFGAVPSSPRSLFKLLSRGEATALYPGGVREAFKSTKKGEQYQLFWPAASDFVPIAAKFDAVIVPVAAVGAEEGFRMLADADEVLSLPLLGERAAEAARRSPSARPGERFVSPVGLPVLPGRFYFLFGRPISTAATEHTDHAACAALYGDVRCELEESIRYLLGRREQDPYQALLPRAVIEAAGGWESQAPTFRDTAV